MMLLYCSEGYEIDRLIRNVIFLNELLPVTEIKTTFNELINYYLSEGSSFIDLFISYFFLRQGPCAPLDLGAALIVGPSQC